MSAGSDFFSIDAHGLFGEKKFFIGDVPKDVRAGVEPFPEEWKKQILARDPARSGMRLGANQKITEMGGDPPSPQTPLPSQSPRSSSEQLLAEKGATQATSRGSFDGSKKLSSEEKRRTYTLDTPQDSNKTIKEGWLLYQQQGSKGWSQGHFVLNAKNLFCFGKRAKSPSLAFRSDDIENIMLRASSDYAIELTVDNNVYIMIADTAKESEEWAICLVRVAPPLLKKKLVLLMVNIFIPSMQAYQTVRTDQTTTVEQVKKIVVEKNPSLEPLHLCLRRGDTARFLEGDESIQLPLLIFKSHFLELRSLDSSGQKPEISKPFDVEGYLSKQGAEGPIKGWKKRYFCTRNGNLFYSKTHPTTGEDENTQETIGLINVANAVGIDMDPTSAQNFEIKTASRTYRLEATSKEEAVVWVVCLRKIREYFRMLNFESWQKTSSIEVITPNEDKLVSCQKEGFLLKKGFFNKAFQERYFILTNGHLFYYTPSDAGQHYRGKIPLKDCRLTILSSNDIEDENAFNLITSGRTYIMKAESLLEMEEWIRAINSERERLA